jgi:hypothetical protein
MREEIPVAIQSDDDSISMADVISSQRCDSDTATSMAVSIPAHGHDVALVQVAWPFNQTKTWLPWPIVRVQTR